MCVTGANGGFWVPPAFQPGYADWQKTHPGTPVPTNVPQPVAAQGSGQPAKPVSGDQPLPSQGLATKVVGASVRGGALGGSSLGG